MSQLILNHSHELGRGARSRATAVYIQRGQYALMFVLLLIIAALSFMYLMKFSNVATKGYEITRLEVERNKLMNEREVLNVRVAQERSLQAYLQEDSRIAHMIQNNNPQYFYPGSSVALK